MSVPLELKYKDYDGNRIYVFTVREIVDSIPESEEGEFRLTIGNPLFPKANKSQYEKKTEYIFNKNGKFVYSTISYS